MAAEGRGVGGYWMLSGVNQPGLMHVTRIYTSAIHLDAYYQGFIPGRFWSIEHLYLSSTMETLPDGDDTCVNLLTLLDASEVICGHGAHIYIYVHTWKN